MVLDIGSQLSPSRSLLYSSFGSSSAGSGISAISSAVAASFISQQASLMMNRTSAQDRLTTFQQTMVNAVDLEKNSWNFLTLQGNHAVLAKREVTATTSTGAASGAVTATASEYATTRTFGLQITQLAREQVTRSDSMTALSPSVSDGSYQFKLNQGGVDYTMSVTVGVGDSNEKVLTSVRDAINTKTGIGVTAEVQTDSDGKKYVQVTNDDTGTHAAFTLSDASGTTLLFQTGLLTSRSASGSTGGTSQTALNAEYEVDGVDYTSQINQVRLFNNSVSVTFNAETPTTDPTLPWDPDNQVPLTMKVQADTAAIADKVEGLLGSWNTQFAFLLENSGPLTTPIALKMNRAAQTVTSQLGRIGITRNMDGLLSLDSEKLQSAIEDRMTEVESALSSPTGLATTSRFISRQVLSAPATFLTHPPNPVKRYEMMSIQRFNTIGAILDLNM